MQSKTISFGFGALLGLACWVVYSPALTFGFVGIDDPIHLVENDSFRGLGVDELRWMFLERHGSAGYDPLAWLSYGIDFRLFGLEPGAFHRTNLILHVLCTLAFFNLTRRVIVCARAPAAHTQLGYELGDSQPAPDVETPSALILAGVVAAIWALHPLRVESVAWLSERHGLLATLFALLSTQAYLRIRGREPAYMEATWPWLLSLLLFTAALLSKSTVLFLPVCFLVLDATLLGRLDNPPTRAQLHDRIVEKLPFFALSLFVGLATLLSRQESGMWSTVTQVSLFDRIAQSLLGLTYYLWKTLVPTGLSPIQLREEWTHHAAWAYMVAALFVLVAASLAFVWRRRIPSGVWAALLAYALLLLPVLGLFQSGPLVVADRYSMLGLVPIFLLLAVGLDRALARSAVAQRGRLPLTAIVAIVIALLCTESWATRRQLAHWRDADTLWDHVFEVSADPALMAHNRGALRMQLGNYSAAADDFELALQGRPNDPSLLNLAGQNAAALGQDERALDLLGQLIERHAEADGAYRARARVRVRTRDLEGAVSDLETYLRVRPDDAEARWELEKIRGELARQRANKRRGGPS